MPTTFTLCKRPIDSVALDILAAAVAKWRPAFVSQDVRIDLMMARNIEGPPLKHGGYPCSAKVKVLPLESRAAGCGDARILVDEHVWDGMEGRGREALLAHEVLHLELVFDAEECEYKRDDLGRPKLKAVPADWHVSDGWWEIVKEYGEDAAEYQSLTKARIAAEAARSGRPKPGTTPDMFDGLPDEISGDGWKATIERKKGGV